MLNKNIQQNVIKHSIRTKLILAMFVLMITSFTIVATFTYYTAKSELDRSGEIIMMNGVNMIKEAIHLKELEVSNGMQDKESAQEEIKQFILGPMDSEGKRPIKKNIDLGKHGYFFILDKNANEIAHPSIEGQNTWDTLDMSGREFYVAQDIIKKAYAGGGFTYYSWKYPYTERIAPKVSYAEVDPNWDWVIVASIYMDDFNSGANRIVDVLIYTFFISLLIGTIIIFYISRHISTPIIKISSEMNQFIEGAFDYVPQQINNRDEIGLLATSFNNMAESLNEEISKRITSEQELQTINLNLETRVAERTQELKSINNTLRETLNISEMRESELEASNLNLEASLDKLKIAQNQLIESEKMAALGNLVAGVAHEINTPLGNSVSMGSFVESNLEKLLSKYNSGELSKSKFELYLNEMTESIKILNHNLRKSADLVISFKEVAVNQQHQIEAEFNVCSYLNKILLSHKHHYKNTNHEIHVECDEKLNLVSFPGAFSQLFSNLIMNSLIHGFKGVDFGVININISLSNNTLNILFSDNGQGVNEDYISKIFQPFFTTNRNNGGSGLGLFIVYNIVTQKLKGSIEVSNGEESGVMFNINIPMK